MAYIRFCSDFSKGHNSRKGDNSDKKKKRVSNIFPWVLNGRMHARTHGQPETNMPRQLLRSWGHNNYGLEELAEMYLQFVASSGIVGNFIFSPKSSLYDPHCRESFGKTVTPALSEIKSNSHLAHGLAVRMIAKLSFTHNIPGERELCWRISHQNNDGNYWVILLV